MSGDPAEPDQGRARVLTILIDHIAIEDGQIAPPAVGEISAFPLLFSERPATEPDTTTVRGILEPSGRAPVVHRGTASWTGMLRGDGWTATWHGTRPRTGRVEITGLFMGVMGIDAAGWVRGRVTSVQIATMFWQRVDTRERFAPIPGRREYRTVDRSPRFFSDERLFTDDPPEVSRADIGVLITLDLDDVPELPPRPALVTGDVSASGDQVWVLDRVLPKLICLGDNSSPTAHLFPGAVRSDRRVWGTKTGCWVSGVDGTFRVEAGAEMGTQVSDIPSTVCATLGDILLACGTTASWTIHEPGSEPVQVDPVVGTPFDAVADGQSFVVVVSDSDEPRRHRMVRVALNGSVAQGPLLPRADRPYPGEWTLLGQPLTAVAENDTFTDVTPQLAMSDGRTIPRRFLYAGAVGDHIWTVCHPPDRTSRSWWPLAGPKAYDRSRGKFWLLTVLDRATLEPVHTAPILSPQPSLTQDESGTIWLAVSGELQRITKLGGTMAWPETVEVDLPEDRPHGELG
ncbi:hypothetical protein QSJ19_24645 [Gordonia sp. ABSL11-1]|uniref:hypothetical protein n=1 Tax=Gordonia sp. ABSL11-1 TaxID=3053924 RepID=UPI002573DEA4|nr:hypothetical protein [Gordonia sp. ABSL11-1]MDL9948716.1 hypothetical protein [Gordonia sp. ABSL11-1]